MNRRLASIAAVLFVLPACGSSQRPPREPPATSPTATAQKASPASSNLAVSEDLAKTCGIVVANTENAPRFAYDSSDLLPDDKAVLDKVARCITVGPLKGRGLRLVGRTDPRGESEYNMTLGEHRAGNARGYLLQLGVAAKSVNETSRGELDAKGKDESGWSRDRRVDILLQ